MYSETNSPENLRAKSHLRLVDDDYELIESGELLTLLKKVVSVVPRSPKHPVLGCIKLEAQNGILTATAGNLGNFILAQMPVNQEFATLVSKDLFVPWLEACPRNTRLKLDVQGDEDSIYRILHIRSSLNEMHYQFRTYHIDQFPDIPELQEDPVTVEFEFESCLEILKSAAKLASTDATRDVINGVQIAIENGVAHIRSTDGYVMGDRTIQVKGEDCEMVLNKELIRLLASAKEASTLMFQVYDQEKMVVATAGEMVVRSRLFPGDYPSFDAIVKPAQAGEIVCERKPLIEALKRCGVAPTKEDNTLAYVWLSACPKKQVVVVEGRKGTETLPAKVDKDPDATYINYRLILEILQSIKTPEIALVLGRGRKSLTVIKPSDGDGYYGLAGLEVEEPNKSPLQEQEGILTVVKNLSYPTEEVSESGKKITVEHHYQVAEELPYECFDQRLLILKDFRPSWKDSEGNHISVEYKKAINYPFEYNYDNEYNCNVLTVLHEYHDEWWHFEKVKSKRGGTSTRVTINFVPAVPLTDRPLDVAPPQEEQKSEFALPAATNWFDDDEGVEPTPQENTESSDVPPPLVEEPDSPLSQIVLPTFGDWFDDEPVEPAQESNNKPEPEENLDEFILPTFGSWFDD